MQEFIIFGLRSVFIGFFFYGIYFFFLKKKAPFGFIRFYLILALVSMGVIPLLPWLGIHFPRLAIFSNVSLTNASLYEVWLKTISIGAKSRNLHNGLSPFSYIYLFVAGIQILRLLWSFISVGLLWLKSDKTKRDGLNIAITPKPIPVFSIFNWIFLDKRTLNLRDVNLILEHEKLHIFQKHTVDLLLGELLRIFLWFNPFIHLFMKEMKANHEFLADISVTESSGQISTYQNLLIQLSTTLDINILTHNFNYSLIKRRITMIKKPKRSVRRFKLYSLTLLAMTGVLFACTTNPETQATQISKKEASIKPVKSDTNIKTQNQVFVVVDHKPKFPGGIKALMNYLGKNTHYPAKARKEGKQGTVYLAFVINKDGSVSDVKVLKGVSPEIDAEAVRVVKNMPKWIPGEQKGKKVRVAFHIPIKFSLK